MFLPANKPFLSPGISLRGRFYIRWFEIHVIDPLLACAIIIITKFIWFLLLPIITGYCYVNSVLHHSLLITLGSFLIRQ